MDLKECLQQAINAHASDVFIIAGLPVSLRKNNIISQFTEERLLPADTENILADIYQYAGNRDMKRLHETGDDDFSFAIKGISRFRVSAYKQRGSLSAVIRIITFDLPNPHVLHIPD